MSKEIGIMDNLAQFKGCQIGLCHNEAIKDYNVSLSIETEDGEFIFLAIPVQHAIDISTGIKAQVDQILKEAVKN